MKKLFLFLLILPLAFVACSDDDETIEPKTDIVGTWIFTKMTAKATTKNDTDNKLAQVIEKAYQREDNVSLTFKADGTFVDPFNTDETGIYTIDGNKLTLKYDGDDEAEGDLTFTLADKNTLYISYDDTERAQSNYKHGEYNYYLEEGETFGSATIEKVTATIRLKRQETVIDQNLLGTWNLKENDMEIVVKNDADGSIAEKIKDYMSPEFTTDNFALTFSDNSRCTRIYNNGESEDTDVYSVEGNQLTIDERTRTFSISGNSLKTVIDLTEEVQRDIKGTELAGTKLDKVIITQTFEAKK